MGSELELYYADTGGLMRILKTGRPQAVRIGIEARAWKKFGDQLYWDVRAVKKFLKEERR